jgi:hypothetical protein
VEEVINIGYSQSILTSIKEMLGPSAEDKHFDPEIIMHINTFMLDLTQIGIGPWSGFTIESDEAVWSDFISDRKDYEAVKTYLYLNVKLVFDPPASSTIVEAMKSQSDKILWRLQRAVELKGLK